MADLVTLKRQRAANKGKLTFIINSLKKDSGTSIEECRAKLFRVEKLMEEFTILENHMYEVDEKVEIDTDYEENYYKAVTELNQKIRKLGLTTGNMNSSMDCPVNTTQVGADIRLPKLNIPVFSGDYTEWQSFHDMYVASIHDSVLLSPVQKFQYLKGLLRGEAASLLRHFSITEANYIEAIQKLRQRYDRKRHTMNAFIRTFLEQPTISHASSQNIKRLMDTSDEVLRGLKAMGTNGEDRDPWLIYIMINKLDDDSKNLWAQETADKDFPTIQELLSFLLRRGDALDSVRVSSKRSTIPSNKPTPVKTHVAIQDQQCSVCQSEGHIIYQCPVFNGMEVEKRREVVKTQRRCFNCLNDSHPVFKCSSKRRCIKCKGRHHTLVHLEEIEKISQKKNESTKNVEKAEVTSHFGSNGEQHVLPTALTEVITASGQTIRCRALLDSGSQVSFITESCFYRLGLPRQNGRMSIKGLGQVEAGITKGMAHISIKSPSGQILSTKVFILKRITKLHNINIDEFQLANFKHLQLADPEFYRANDVDLLIGVDQFFDILIAGELKHLHDNLVLQNTIFGWVVAGAITDKSTNEDNSLWCGTNSIQEFNIDETLKRFWELEAIPNVTPILTPEEELCEGSFKNTYRRNSDGRCQVRLPFKADTSKLGCSLNAAIQRLRSMERRFSRDHEFHKLYSKFMNDYLTLGHMEEIPNTTAKDDGFFLPHHGVIKAGSSTTKLRVVFDGSAKTSSGVSLNDCLAVGPTVQSSLYAIILRFREHRIIFSADIEKMYRQIQIHEDDTKFQKIVWRNTPSDPIRYFKLFTVTYGLASAPYLATRVLKQVAEDVSTSHPKIANIIERSIYIDDLMTGGDTIEDAKNLKASIRNILSSYGFTLRKWVSNSPEVINDIPHEDQEQHIKAIDDTIKDKAIKILGLQYDPTDDIFKFQVSLPVNPKVTKRTILSEAGKLFDPLGWMAPVSIKIKIFIQQLWILNLHWDDPLPQEKALEWDLIRTSLPMIEEISIPRFVQTTTKSTVELHGFCDASQLAYAAVIYYKVTSETGEIYTSLMSAKTKVAPIKQQSLPRLELCGAVLLAKLMNVVKEETNVNIEKVVLWTDSTIVLDWLSDHPRRWPTFIANRTSEILSSYDRKLWRHVPTSQNPADIASRGIHPQEVKLNQLWWTGPHWLQKSTESWPPQQRNYANFDLNANIIVHISTMEPNIFDSLIEKCSSFHKLQRTVAYCFRFIAGSRQQRVTKNTSKFITRNELYEALFHICKYDQRSHFRQEIQDLQKSRTIKPSSSLKSLSPFIDEFGVLRVGGRLENSEVSFSTKHPIILSAKSAVTALILEEMHRQHKHAGPSLLLALSRQQYWIPNARNLIRKLIHECVPCTRHKATCGTQLMGNLPSYRSELVRPFLKVGVDFAGPLLIHLSKGRGQKTYKAYICLFVCLSTKAVHIELVSALSSDAFLAALKRFVARRGCCQDIYSDNGSNFIGANNQLITSFQNCIKNSNDISHFLSRTAIDWHFIPPSAPHFGGIWESAIKATKFHLRRVIGDSILTMEEMITLLAEIESILNSRPLCVLSAEEIDALTPSHFLIGHASTKLPEYDISQLKPSHLTRWQMVQYMNQHFWKRWYLEYITSLQQKSKWFNPTTPLNLDDIVIIKDDNLPVSKWLLGRVIALHPGSDGLTRVVTLKTKTGELKRPVTKLVTLPVERDRSKPAVCSATADQQRVDTDVNLQ